MTTLSIARPQPFDLPPPVRMAIALASGGLFALTFYAAMRWMLGFAPPTPWVRDFALSVHLVTVIPAIPLGGYLFATRKGGPRHRLLGKVWLAMMLTTAVSTIFIRNLNNGGFSWIHLLTLLAIIAVPQALISARRGDIAAHRKHMLTFYLGSLIIAGGFTFLPGRTMWQWAFG